MVSTVVLELFKPFGAAGGSIYTCLPNNRGTIWEGMRNESTFLTSYSWCILGTELVYLEPIYYTERPFDLG